MLGSSTKRPEWVDESLTSELFLGSGYRLLRKLGEGGSGEVYEAQHRSLGFHVAIKLMGASSVAEPGARRRFVAESRALASIDHPQVVRVFDTGETADRIPFTVMELLLGVDLRQLLRQVQRLPIPRAAKLLHDACLGVTATHQAGFIHRDLKPENLFVKAPGTAHESCVLIDFGVVKGVDSTATRRGTLVGTVRYMAPEQARGETLDERTDVYALGCILFEILAGTPAIGGNRDAAVLHRIMNEAPPLLTTALPGVPDALSNVVARAMARDPQQRFESARSLARSLEPFMVSSGLLSSSAASVAATEITREATLREASQVRASAPVRRALQLAAACALAGGFLGYAGRAFVEPPLVELAPPLAVEATASAEMQTTPPANVAVFGELAPNPSALGETANEPVLSQHQPLLEPPPEKQSSSGASDGRDARDGRGSSGASAGAAGNKKQARRAPSPAAERSAGDSSTATRTVAPLAQTTSVLAAPSAAPVSEAAGGMIIKNPYRRAP